MRRPLPMTYLLALVLLFAAPASTTLAQTAAPTAMPQAKTAPVPSAPAATPEQTPAPAATPAAPAPAPSQPTPAAEPVAPPPPADAKAAGIPVEELVKPVTNLNAAIDAAEKNLEQAPGSQGELAALRAEIEKIGSNAKKAGDSLAPALEEVRSQIAKLGAPPAANQPPEAEDVAAERQRLNSIAAQIDGAIKKAALIELRSRQLVSRVQHARQGVFTRFLLRQTDTPLQREVWSQAANQLPLAKRQIGFIVSNWLSVAKHNSLNLLAVLGLALAAFIVLRVLVRRFIRSQLDNAGPSTPPVEQRAAAAAWVIPALALPACVALTLLYVGLDEIGLLYWQVERIAQSALLPMGVLIANLAVWRGLLQPSRPRWRLFDISDQSARRVCLAAQAIATVYVIDAIIRHITAILSLPLSASIVVAFIASLLYAALIIVIVRTPLTAPAAAPGIPVSLWQPYWLKVPLLILAGVLVATSLLGYVSLGRFIVAQVLTTGVGLVLLTVLYAAIGAIVPKPSDHSSGMNAIIEQRLSLDDFGRMQLMRVQRGLLTLALFSIAVPLLLLSWGFSIADIRSWARAAVFGFDIGGLHISLVRIFAAIVLFVVLLALTRFVQRWLAAGALAQGRIEAGLANSIYTGAGYVGFAVATLAALSYAGFDITSLAIVAGALSVGIGFGLQSIVNNFVSGLILLVERPIKVGDWVSLKEGEGYVRRIAVRATEVETFGRASLIVPNSELISQTVVNLTHRNLLGRLKIGVRVSYQADPEHVLRVLQSVAERNTSILRHPPPVAVLDNLGENAMEFSLRVFLADINRSLQAQTELRAAIVKSLRDEGIDIPYLNALAGHASAASSDSGDRTSISVSVAQNADPVAVLEALRETARRAGLQGDKDNATRAAFEEIGDGALKFALSVSLPEGVSASHAQTLLRAHLIHTFRERGIELASPERQVRLRDLDGLRTFLVRMAQERAMRASDEPTSSPPRNDKDD